MDQGRFGGRLGKNEGWPDKQNGKHAAWQKALSHGELLPCERKQAYLTPASPSNPYLAACFGGERQQDNARLKVILLRRAISNPLLVPKRPLLGQGWQEMRAGASPMRA